MSNGHDHPGTYRTLQLPQDAVSINALCEAQKAEDYYLVSYNSQFATFYKKGK